jgi:hypothetical protein
VHVGPKFTKASFAWVLGVLLLIKNFLFLFCQGLPCSSDIRPGLLVVGVVLVNVVPEAVADLLIGMHEPVLPRHISASFISKQTCFALHLATGIAEPHNSFLSLHSNAVAVV